MRYWTLSVLLAAAAIAACERPQPPPPREAPSMLSRIYGTWVYAEDPTGTLPTEPIYTGTRVYFGADGVYRFTMGQIVLEGTYTVVEQTDLVHLRVTLARGEEMDVRVQPRDGAIVIYEGNGDLPGHYHVRAE